MAKSKGAPIKRNGFVPFAYLSPALLTIAIFSIFPMLYTIYLSFTNFNLNHFDTFQYVGFDNYKEILAGPFFDIFFPVFIWTVIYALGATGFAYLAGLVLALLLNNDKMKETNIYRGILIIPWAIPAAIAILAWQGLWNDSFGQINTLLSTIGLPKVPWLTDPFWARVAITITTVWLGYPFMMNVCLGALQAIPKDLYEAADIDGAGRWKKFRYVTFPGLMSSTLPLLISSFAFNFNNFGAAYLITAGGPPGETQYAGHTDLLATAAYNLTMTSNRYDLAATLSFLIFIVVGTLSFINMKATKAFEEVD